ncbi:DUF4443 domain-containing protein [Nitrosopumilus sp.]|uniref:DUF4443 domain-containing protein n=1 Tax=Nitrosopumilus sp. TaxID=2024843 RepID=UPI00260EF9A3|nr:DUF4443 domain-containing protein [Nitrosopumilus sp.]
MQQQIKTLQKITSRKRTSKSLTFSIPHVLKSILLLSKQKYVSRATLCDELHMGEGAVRTLISYLKEYEFVDSIKAGTFLTTKGKNFAKKFQEAMPYQSFLKKCCLTNGDHNCAIILRKEHVSNIGNGMQQRDYAILYGADDALTLRFKNGEFVFVGDEVVCFADESEIKENLIEALHPRNNDIVIITSSNDKFVVEISAINTALWTLGSQK